MCVTGGLSAVSGTVALCCAMFGRRRWLIRSRLFFLIFRVSCFVYFFAPFITFLHRLFLSSIIRSSSLFPVCCSSVLPLAQLPCHVTLWQRLSLSASPDVTASLDRADRCAGTGASVLIVVLQNVAGTLGVHYRCADCSRAA
jgi:hypothetical protein